VPDYSIQIKLSAQKEMDALEDALFVRIDRKVLALAGAHAPKDARN
jgi:hypothetical protein